MTLGSESPEENMAAVGRLNFPKAIREIRVHLCQTSKSSQGVSESNISYCVLCQQIDQTGKFEKEVEFFRDFLEKYYVGLKKENPKFPFLVRECSGIQPKIHARYGFGNETSVSLADTKCEEVFQEMHKLAKAQS